MGKFDNGSRYPGGPEAPMPRRATHLQEGIRARFDL